MILALLGAAISLLPQDTISISLDAATARAVAVSPTVAAATGARAAPAGLRIETRWPFPTNPTLALGRVRRLTASATTYDRDLAVTQEVEIAGQSFWRSAAAAALVRAAEAGLADARRTVALDARVAYVALAMAERRSALTDSAATFAERLAGFARKQFDAGEANRLELNAAVLEAARARSTATRAAAAATAAAADLARLLGMPTDSTPRTTILPTIPALRWRTDSQLVQIARSRRPDLTARNALTRKAQLNVTAARLAMVPNLTAALFQGREAGTDRLLGVSVGLTMPLFHRQQASSGAAHAELSAARAEALALDRAIQASALSAGARFQRARDAERRFATEVLRAADDNVVLTERALAEGEVSLTDVIVLRAAVLNAQLEYLDVLRDAATSWFELAAALAVEPADLDTLLTTGH